MGKRKKTNCTTFVCQFVVVLETEASESSLGPDTLLKTRTIHRFPHAPNTSINCSIPVSNFVFNISNFLHLLHLNTNLNKLIVFLFSISFLP